MDSPIILIANPVAKRTSENKIRKAVELLRSKRHEVNLFLTQKKGDAEDFAKKAAESGATLVIAAGGDGTFNEVINGLANSVIPMAILPMGTTNVLAKELGIPEEVEGAIGVILSKNAHSVSLGSITFTRGSSRSTRYFCLMAGIGFDAQAVYSVNETLKKFSGKGAYILSGLKALMGYSPNELVFTVNVEMHKGYSAVIGNASKYGGNFRITPHASLSDPHLYLCIMHGRGRRDIFRYAYGIVRGSHLRLKDITYIKADSIKIEGYAHIQIDGDYLGKTPAEITVVPDALKLIF